MIGRKYSGLRAKSGVHNSTVDGCARADMALSADRGRVYKLAEAAECDSPSGGRDSYSEEHMLLGRLQGMYNSLGATTSTKKAGKPSSEETEKGGPHQTDGGSIRSVYLAIACVVLGNSDGIPGQQMNKPDGVRWLF